MKLNYLEKIMLYPTYCEVHLGAKFHKDGKVTIQQISYFQYRILLEYVRNLIKEIIDIPSQEVRKALFFEDHCVQCGECCRKGLYVKFTPLEAKIIANYLNIKIDEFLKEFTEPYFSWDSQSMVLKNRKLKDNFRGSCIFLQEQSDGTANCKIHLVRPKWCQDYKPPQRMFCKITEGHIGNILEVLLFLDHLELITVQSQKGIVSNPVLGYKFYPRVVRWVQKITEELKEITLPDEIVFVGQSDIKCAQCGSCCYFKSAILATDEDINQLAKFLNITSKDFIDKYTHCEITWDKEAKALNRTNVLLFEGSSCCVFLKRSEDKLFYCSVYPARPQVCRDYKPGVYCGPEQNWMPF